MKTLTKVVVAVTLAGGVATGVAAYGQKPYCQHRGGAEHRAAHVLERIGNRLGLTPAQFAKAEAVKDQLLALRQATRDERRQGRDAAIDLLSAPTLDQDKALALVTRKTARMNELAPQLVAALADFTDSLRPEQRAELQQLLRDRLGGRFFGRRGSVE